MASFCTAAFRKIDWLSEEVVIGEVRERRLFGSWFFFKALASRLEILSSASILLLLMRWPPRFELPSTHSRPSFVHLRQGGAPPEASLCMNRGQLGYLGENRWRSVWLSTATESVVGEDPTGSICHPHRLCRIRRRRRGRPTGRICFYGLYNAHKLSKLSSL